jgi:hypothetical protein
MTTRSRRKGCTYRKQGSHFRLPALYFSSSCAPFLPEGARRAEISYPIALLRCACRRDSACSSGVSVPRNVRTKLSVLTGSFLVALSIATITMLTRCTFRVAELSKGFHSKIWYNEVDYMVLEGAMVSTSALLLTIGHPGPAFGGRYHDADFPLRIKKGGSRRRYQDK